jgi:hypothetical protein
MLILTACKKECDQTATVVRDFTGTYLRLKGKDYQVCNHEKISSFPIGATVTATFRKLTHCNDSDKVISSCFLFHENEGWIVITKIK